MKRIRRLARGRAHLMVLAVAFAATLALELLSMFQSMNEALVSLRMRATPIEASGKYIFVSIDARSLHALGVWPWPREVYASVVRTLMEAGATEVYLDLDLSARSTPEGDAALEDALEEAGGSVILPIFRQQRGFGIRQMTRNMPISDFQEHAWLGVITLPVDGDGLVRRYPYGARIGAADVPSVAALLSGEFGPPGTEFLINFGIVPESVPSVSLIDLLLGHARTDFEGRSVVVGAHAMELRTPITVPVHGVVPGPLVHILAAETLDRHLELKRLSGTPGLIAVGVLGLFIAARGRGHMPLVVLTLAATSAVIEGAAFWAHATYQVIVPTVSLHKVLLITGIVVGARELDLRRLLLQMLHLEMLNMERILEPSCHSRQQRRGPDRRREPVPSACQRLRAGPLPRAGCGAGRRSRYRRAARDRGASRGGPRPPSVGQARRDDDARADDPIRRRDARPGVHGYAVAPLEADRPQADEGGEVRRLPVRP